MSDFFDTDEDGLPKSPFLQAVYIIGSICGILTFILQLLGLGGTHIDRTLLSTPEYMVLTKGQFIEADTLAYLRPEDSIIVFFKENGQRTEIHITELDDNEYKDPDNKNNIYEFHSTGQRLEVEGSLPGE